MNLSELLKDNLKRLLSSEEQQLEAMCHLANKANARSLQQMIHAYAGNKEINISRLKKSLGLLTTAAHPNDCRVVSVLIADCQNAMLHAGEEHVSDAALIATLQQINHFNIANYGTASSYAKTLKHGEISHLLHNALEEEKKTDEYLTKVAEKIVNPSAVLAA